MPTTRSRRRAAGAAALAIAALGAALSPSAVHAADAPLRTIGLTPTGEATAGLRPVAVAPDGREVVQATVAGAYVRDVVAGTTTLLAEGIKEVQASNDTKLVAVETTRPLTAADTDTDADIYLIDRAAGNAATLVTGAELNLDTSETQVNTILGALLISGDGNVVRYTVSRAIKDSSGSVTWSYEQWRYDRASATNTRSALSSPPGASVRRLDDAGRVEVTDTQVKVDGRAWPIPASAGVGPAASIAPDGGAVVFSSFVNTKMTVLNTTTGAVRTVTAPSWIGQYDLDVLAPWNGGGDFVLIGVRLTRTAGPRYALGRLQVSNGVLTQYGPDIPLTSASNSATVAPNLEFAATNVHLAQLGSTPLPGAEPSTPSNAKALDYFEFSDATCSAAPFGGYVYTRPQLGMRKVAQGTDLRTPQRGIVKVTMNGGGVANWYVAAPGSVRDLYTGRLGGFRIEATVLFTDGSTLSGSRSIPTHESPYCTPFYWF